MMHMSEPAGHTGSLTERMWTRLDSWEDIRVLLKDPKDYVERYARSRLGELMVHSTVDIVFSYPHAHIGMEPGEEVVVEGIADTNVINVRILETAYPSREMTAPASLPAFDEDHGLHVIFRRSQHLVYGHFHFVPGDTVARDNAFWAARYPAHHFDQINERIRSIIAYSQSGSNQIMVTDEEGNPLDIKSLYILPQLPRTFTVQVRMRQAAVGSHNSMSGDHHSAIDSHHSASSDPNSRSGVYESTIGGCNSASGTFTNTGGACTVCLDTVDCSDYAPPPPPPPPPTGL
jgi:hypothetical protein